MGYEMAGHIHAHLMAQYAQDAQRVNRPWELWQQKTVTQLVWRDLDRHPDWQIRKHYRRKPEAPPELSTPPERIFEKNGIKWTIPAHMNPPNMPAENNKAKDGDLVKFNGARSAVVEIEIAGETITARIRS